MDVGTRRECLVPLSQGTTVETLPIIAIHNILSEQLKKWVKVNFAVNAQVSLFLPTLFFSCGCRVLRLKVAACLASLPKLHPDRITHRWLFYVLVRRGSLTQLAGIPPTPSNY
jgi:hypothetical protein